MLKKDYVRDGNRRIIASVTTGYCGAHLMSSETSTTKSVGTPVTCFTRHATGAGISSPPTRAIRVF